jgi:hypothetical protein
MRRICCLLCALALVTGCASRWWEQELREWRGAPVSEVLDAWGPPMRTRSEADGRTVLVYESSRELDRRIDSLRDPSSRLGVDGTPRRFEPSDRGDCTLFFEVAAEKVVAVRHEGAPCDIVPRDPERRRTDPPPLRQR